MPILSDNEETAFTTPSAFQFSAVSIDDLEASEFTLVCFACDESGSVQAYKSLLEGALKTATLGCQKSPRADNMMVRTVAFGSQVKELHGFEPLTQIGADRYANAIHPAGMTALFDAAVSAVDSCATFGKELQAREYSANAIVVILTDGDDNSSTNTARSVAEAVARAQQQECLESILTILVGVGVKQDPYGKLSGYLSKFKTDASLDQYVEVDDLSSASFAKIAKFIEQSVSSQSQSLGSGSASQAITF